MNWGTKIAVLYGGFVVLIVSMVSMAMRQKVDLVSKDYYQQELEYQDRIDQIGNTGKLEEPLSWETKKGSLEFHFPHAFAGKTKQAEVYFFRPSDAAMDHRVLVAADTFSTRSIPTETLARGVYKMQVTWEAENKKYYNEGIIQIN